jgi:hypothetical protein
MMLAAIGFLIASAFTRIRSKDSSRATCAFFGGLLGLAALTKSFMFGVGIVILVISIAANRKRSGSLRRHAISIAVFLAMTLPQLALISAKTGRLTFSDSARLVYALKVNEISRYWIGAHARVLSTHPLALEYPHDFPDRTYPRWDDPSFWYEGAPVHFDRGAQVRALTRNLLTDAGLGLKIAIPLLVIVLCRDRRSRMRNVPLAIVSLLVIAGYALLYSEGRLVGFWIALLAASVLTGIELEKSEMRGRIGLVFINLISVISVISFVTYILDQTFSSEPDRGWNARHAQLDVARKLGDLGVTRGSRVALVGDFSDIYWARLARVKVDIEIPAAHAPAYWEMSDSGRDSLNRRISSTGAAAIVASWTDPPASLTRWIRVPGTRYSILPLHSGNR